LSVEDLLNGVVTLSHYNDEQINIGRIDLKYAEGDLLNLSTVQAVWARTFFTRDRQTIRNLDSMSLYRASEFETFLSSLEVNLSDKKWVNYPEAESLVSFKNVQLSVASLLGLRVPDYFIGNDPQQAKKFISKHEFVALKAYHSPSFVDENQVEHIIATKKLPTDDLSEQLDTISSCPVILQEYIEKRLELRIIVIGANIFTCAMDTQTNTAHKDDFRLNDLTNIAHQSYELPENIKFKILKLMQYFRLSFGCIDMIYTPQREYVFLEINPNGQWLWVEQRTGLPIAKAIADYLAS